MAWTVSIGLYEVESVEMGLGVVEDCVQIQDLFD